MPPQTGDRFMVVAGALQDQIVRADLLEIGAAPVECFPIDPASGIQRKRNRLNRVLALRLDAAEMSEATRERSADGVLIYLRDLHPYRLHGSGLAARGAPPALPLPSLAVRSTRRRRGQGRPGETAPCHDPAHAER